MDLCSICHHCPPHSPQEPSHPSGDGPLVAGPQLLGKSRPCGEGGLRKLFPNHVMIRAGSIPTRCKHQFCNIPLIIPCNLASFLPKATFKQMIKLKGLSIECPWATIAKVQIVAIYPTLFESTGLRSYLPKAFQAIPQLQKASPGFTGQEHRAGASPGQEH